jgi:predicted lipid-binding transport protein (Tim44 family)
MLFRPPLPLGYLGTMSRGLLHRDQAMHSSMMTGAASQQAMILQLLQAELIAETVTKISL